MSDLITIEADVLHQILGKLDGIERRLDKPTRQSSIYDLELWTAKEIATHLRTSAKAVLSHTIKLPGFPEPVGEGTRNRKWKSREIIAWSERRPSRASSPARSRLGYSTRSKTANRYAPPSAPVPDAPAS